MGENLRIRSIVLFAICVLIVVAAIAIAFVNVRSMQEQTRGVTFGAARKGPAPLGVNVSLEQYSNDDEQRALKMIRDGGFHLVRQHFYWSEIEPQRGEFLWTQSDRMVTDARENNLDLIAVLDTTPVWARDPGEADLVNAAPAHVEEYAAFVQAFVSRYGNNADASSWHLYVQLWDNPNIHPFWGRRNVDPVEYTALLRAGAIAARSANPGIKVLSAGLAPNEELIRDHPDYSDVLFLRGMYEAGAQDYFDILGAKPYGMWTGPEDRRASMDVFNFSRVILLREEMVAHGDAAKPVWAVEFGWNALPKGWEGKSSPWGTDSTDVQGRRLLQAVQRAKSEWSWMGAMVLQTFQPNAPSNDPLWGFALVDKDMRPLPLYTAAVDAVTIPVQPATFDFTRFYALLAMLAVVGGMATWGAVRQVSYLPLAEAWGAIAARFAVLPEWVQFALPSIAVLALYFSRNTVLNFAALGMIILLFALRLDIGLALAIFAVPFYLLPKNLVGSMQFSLVEILTLAAAVAWAMREMLDRGPVTADRRLGRWQSRLTAKADLTPRPSPPLRSEDLRPSPKRKGELPFLPLGHRPRDFQREEGPGERSAFDFAKVLVGRMAPQDWAVMCFVLIGILSVRVAANFGVASREFRVIVVEPALLYGLIRAAGLTPRDRQRLIDAFILSALAISLIGLYQFFFTNYVIVAEGVRRILAVYGSPNNLALFLERALPLVIVLALFVEERRRRIAYSVIAVPIALCLYLTYSRGAYLIALPAALLFVGFFSGRRIRLAIVALVVVGAIALIPFAATGRFWSLFDTGTGTGFFRVSVWQSGVAMLRDHPLFGVGLDNFLYEFPRYMNPDAWREPNLSHPHNIVLDFWLRMGILGLGVMIWMVLQFYRQGIKALESRKGKALTLGLMAGMTAALAHGMIDAAYFYVDLAFVWMMMLAVIREWKLEIGD